MIGYLLDIMFEMQKLWEIQSLSLVGFIVSLFVNLLLPPATTNTFQKSNWEDPKYIDALLAEWLLATTSRIGSCHLLQPTYLLCVLNSKISTRGSTLYQCSLLPSVAAQCFQTCSA